MPHLQQRAAFHNYSNFNREVALVAKRRRLLQLWHARDRGFKGARVYASDMFLRIFSHLFRLPSDEHPEGLAKERRQQRVERRSLLHERVEPVKQPLFCRDGLVDLGHLASEELGGHVRKAEPRGLVHLGGRLFHDVGDQFEQDVGST